MRQTGIYLPDISNFFHLLKVVFFFFCFFVSWSMPKILPLCSNSTSFYISRLKKRILHGNTYGNVTKCAVALITWLLNSWHSIQYCLGVKTRRQDKTMFTCICTDLTGFQSINRGIEINMSCDCWFIENKKIKNETTRNNKKLIRLSVVSEAQILNIRMSEKSDFLGNSVYLIEENNV